jgi:quercetin dioxygenase-like cupin family protein
VECLNDAKLQRVQGYPDAITRLPAAGLQVDGARGWILQSESSQLVFFEFEAGSKIPEHSHSYAQWGIVVDGKLELIIDGAPRMCEKGSEYVIPAGAKHFARFPTHARVMDYFSEKNRYRPKVT